MVTEYIKRGQKWGYDENGVLLYKIPVDEPSPLILDEKADDEDEELLLFEDE